MQSRWWFNSDASFEIHHTASALHLSQPHLEPSVCSPSQTQLAKLPFGSHSAPCHQHTPLTRIRVFSPLPFHDTTHLSRCPSPHTHTHTHAGAEVPKWPPHGKCYNLAYDAMGIAMLAWAMVRFLPLDGGMFVVSLSPLDCCPCTHLNSRGSH